jgi:UDP-N-acetylglucosamine--N-acetylmuramyl-(pentapeptide) pyrophosphoryl-undecaprenol N-acetylglucosamine transferase
MVSPKEVDQRAADCLSNMEIVALPAVGLNRRGWLAFISGFCKSYRLARRLFARNPPDVLLAMGGFVSAPAALAGRRCGAKTFLHESNSIPGRANLWLARWVDGVFVYFPAAAKRLPAHRVEVTGMPVRPQFLNPLAAEQARAAVGLKPQAPVLLIMGGSQGASAINQLVVAALPQLRQASPELQFMHLAGARDADDVRAAYRAQKAPGLVLAFFNEMGTALAAADVAVSRAGASSLAELAARRLPAVLIPYPAAAGNHQYFNALAFAQCGAARLLQQAAAAPGQLAGEILNLTADAARRSTMRQALEAWHAPGAAARIADRILHWNGAETHAPAGAPKLKAQKARMLNC